MADGGLARQRKERFWERVRKRRQALSAARGQDKSRIDSHFCAGKNASNTAAVVLVLFDVPAILPVVVYMVLFRVGPVKIVRAHSQDLSHRD